MFIAIIVIVIVAVIVVKLAKKSDQNNKGSTAQLLRQALSNHPSGRKP